MRTSARTLLASLSSIVMLCCAQGVLAQGVNKCTVGGRVVYQSSPCAIEVRPAPAGVVADAAANPANASATPKKKTLADMLRERDGAAPAQSATREFQQDGANVLRPRMGAV
ncbi:MAG TPA: hypothetical protein VJN68_12100 [Burkholderiaceae bacterium]|nr:hypothetical protein [Burkholderiaceae bacterium]